MPDDAPRWRRRKQARPAEILDAALAVFAEQGFAAAKLTEIARRAGVSKAALYLYFETKQELFRAAARTLVAPNLAAIAEARESADSPFADLAPVILARAAAMLADGRASAVVKMVVSESGNFPDLAAIWRDDVVEQMLSLISRLIARAQARGEVKPGDPRVFALFLISPVLLGVIWRETFVPIGAPPFDLEALAAQHVETALRGMLSEAAPA